MSENDEFIREFLDESAENLDQLDQDLVALEKNPRDKARLESVFRTIHTVKGTSGFFGFSKLGALAHDGESLLGRVRDGELLLEQEIATALLNLVDSIREMLANIEASGSEGKGDYRPLSAKLIRLASTPAELPPHEEMDEQDKEQDKEQDEDQDKEQDKDVSDSASSSAARLTGATDGGQPLVQQVSDLEPSNVLSPPTESAAGDRSAVAAPPPDPASLSSDTSYLPFQPAVASVASSGVEGSIRVDVRLLDQLMDLTGELVLARNRLNQFSIRSDDRPLVNAIQRLSLITSELQEGITQTRMQPVSTIWSKLPRLIRDLTVACGKQIEMEQEGEDTELDRSLLEAIKDPLTHLIRNAVDHGIEPPEVRIAAEKPPAGRVSLRAYHKGGQVHMEVADDGRGIDVARVRQRAIQQRLVSSDQAAEMSDEQIVQLVFEPGFSTADQVSNVSGRGVGMDVVKTNIQRIGGAIELENRPGFGTNVRLTIPLTLAILPALIVKDGNERFAIPQAGVTELLHFRGEEIGDAIEWFQGEPVCRLRGDLLPLVYLDQVLRRKTPMPREWSVLDVVVVEAEGHRLGLVVEQVLNTEEVVVKPLGRCLGSIHAFAGTTIMGDGAVALILDVAGIAREVGMSLEIKRNPVVDAVESASTTVKYLLCELEDPEDDAMRRVALPLAEIDRLAEFGRDEVQKADGRDVVPFNNRIMPLVQLAPLLDAVSESRNNDQLPVVVCQYQQQPIGLIVSRVLDIVDHTPIPDQRLPSRGPVVGSCVIEDRVTDVIDLPTLFREANVLFDKTADHHE